VEATLNVQSARTGRARAFNFMEILLIETQV
jgi:hypothetical protein